jgi:hypothetical protein
MIRAMRQLLHVLAALLLAGALAAAAHTAITVSLTPTSAPPDTTLNGVDQTTSVDATITITGGTNAGWNIKAWAPLPTLAGLSLGPLVVPTEPTSGNCSGGRSCSDPNPTGITWPVTLGVTAGTASKIYNARANSGNLNNSIDLTFTINVPASALPGDYSTTLTIVGGTGP